MTTTETEDVELLPGLPENARLWIFGVERPLQPQEERRLLEVVDAFLADWHAHGAPLSAAREWREGRFLLVAVDPGVAPPSGCSIDALVRVLSGLESEFGIEILASGPVWYRAQGPEGRIERVSRPIFRERAAAGEVTAETVVYDLSLTRLGDARAGRWKTRAGASWHRRFLPS